MDFRQFLQDGKAELRLPYAAGLKTCDDKRSWRLREEIPPGWYRFREAGRYLEMVEAIEPELDGWKLPSVRGYLAQGRFVTQDSMERLFGLPGEEEPPRFAPLVARRWFDGRCWFEMGDFESEAEEAVRSAFEEERGITGIKGVTPALAQAFLLDHTAREMAREAERRRREEAAAAERAAELARWQESAEGRIALALSHAGARLLDWRRSGRRRATVRYQLGGRAFECVIDIDSLQILDAGICLEGADQELNLSSLPSAVREAIETGQLHVFR
jgi:hypothetical protein